MNITITFNDLSDAIEGVERLHQLLHEAAFPSEAEAAKAAAAESAKAIAITTKTPVEENSAPQAETPEKAAEASQTAPQEAKAEPESAAEKPAIDESYRAEVRKVLTRLNKKISGNPAAQLIQEVSGKRRLTDVPLELLPDLMKKAKEALKDAD